MIAAIIPGTPLSKATKRFEIGIQLTQINRVIEYIMVLSQDYYIFLPNLPLHTHYWLTR